MTASDLRLLIDYHYWARTRMLRAVTLIGTDEFIAPRGSSFGSIRDTLAHTYFAEWVWYSRWQGQSPAKPRDLAEIADAASLQEKWSALEAEVRAYLAPLSDEDVRRVIDYRFLDGREASSPLWQMVQHVVNHASYHRGQVTTMLRQMGAEAPQPMDLIAFYRKRGIT